jgi:hypothetical protein
VRVLFIALVASSLCGCAVFDALFGVNPDGTQNEGGGILGVASGILGWLIPAAPAVAASAAGLYAHIRGKRWKAATVSTFQTIEAAASLGKDVKELKADLKDVHKKAGGGVLKIVQGVVDQFGHTKSEPVKA